MKVKSLEDFPSVMKYLNRVNAEVRSMLKAVVKEQTGSVYWIDKCIISFTKTGEIKTSMPGFEPLPNEAEAIKADFASAEWPETVFIDPNDPNLPSLVKESDPENVFWFKDVNGNVTMIQVKKVVKGERSYIPITYYDDGEYRFLEPDRKLDLYGLENLKGNSTVILSEGAAAARHGQRIADGLIQHPWSVELSNAAHLGWTSGAMSPERVDWSVLKKHGVTRLYIIADHDLPGLSAVPKIAKEVDCVTMMIQFTDDWAPGSDIKDPFPGKLFKEINGSKYWVGPSFRQCCHPATYMTRLIPYIDDKGKERKKAVLRNHAKGLWTYIEDQEVFVNTEMPEIVRKADSLNAMLTPFSDTKKTHELILESFTGRTKTLAYDPRVKGRRVMSNGEAALNMYVPSDIKAQPGDPKPWIDFLSHLIPDEIERKMVEKWAATVIAKPEVHIKHALLLASSQTGTGKGTFCRILSVLVGQHNASTPTERQIMEPYTGWIARKRLVTIAEVYQGHSWKLANTIKEYVTDEDITLRLMYQDTIPIKNFAHFVACSNSDLALKIEDMDRRWCIPTITEKNWGEQNFNNFFEWLESGGYSIIMYWAENYGDYYRTGTRAPDTKRKQDMIADSRGDIVNAAMDLGLVMGNSETPLGIGMIDMMEWLRQQSEGRMYETALDIKKALKKTGIKFSAERISVDSRTQDVFFNDALAALLVEAEGKGSRNNIWKQHRVKPTDIMDGRF